MSKKEFRPFKRDTSMTCWSDCPEEQRERCQEAFMQQQLNGDDQQGRVALLESTRPECEIGGPVYFLGELICGANVDPREV
jgi:hypothetical protein